MDPIKMYKFVFFSFLLLIYFHFTIPIFSEIFLDVNLLKDSVVEDYKKWKIYLQNKENISRQEKALINNWFEIIEDMGYSLVWCSWDDNIISSKKMKVKKDWIEQIVRVCCWFGFIFPKWCTIRY